MEKKHGSPLPEGNGKDELNDSWFDLPVLDLAPPAKKARAPEDDLDDSWFDRPGRGIRRSDVVGPR